MLTMIYGERYKLKRANLSKIMIIIYIFTGIIFFVNCINFLNSFNALEISNDDTISIFSFMLGDITEYGTEIKSTIVILGIITVFGLMSALFVVPIFTSINITDEYFTRSIHQLTCKGISRYKFILSKYYSICEFVTLTNSFVCIIGIIITIVMIGQGNVLAFLPNIIYYVIKLCMINFAFTAVCLFCSIGIKYCGAAMPVNFIVIICMIGELAKGLFSSKLLFPILTYLAIIVIFLVAAIYIFNRSDI